MGNMIKAASTLLEKIDRKVCSYLQLNAQYEKPCTVEFDGSNLFVISLESYKRHVHKVKWSMFNLDQTTQEDKKKLGIATGKSLAKHLTISFDPPKVHRL